MAFVVLSPGLAPVFADDLPEKQAGWEAVDDAAVHPQPKVTRQNR